MERQNRRERILLGRRNNDLGYSNRPRLENPFSESENEDEEQNLNDKKEIEEIINFIPTSIIKEENKLNNNNYKCMICLSNFKIGDKESILPCLHIFHSKCIEKWILRAKTCPICKFDISLESLLSHIGD